MCCAINSGSASPAQPSSAVAGDVGGGADGVAQGLFGEIGGASAAFAFADVNGNVQRLVLLELDLFDFAQPHADALSDGFAEIGFGGGRARYFCQVECAAAEVEKFGSGVVEQHRNLSWWSVAAF